MAVAERGVGMGMVVMKCMQVRRRRICAWSDVKVAGRVRVAAHACCGVQVDCTGWMIVCCVSEGEEEVARFVRIVCTYFLGVMVGKSLAKPTVPSHQHHPRITVAPSLLYPHLTIDTHMVGVFEEWSGRVVDG